MLYIHLSNVYKHVCMCVGVCVYAYTIRYIYNWLPLDICTQQQRRGLENNIVIVYLWHNKYWHFDFFCHRWKILIKWEKKIQPLWSSWKLRLVIFLWSIEVFFVINAYFFLFHFNRRISLVLFKIAIKDLHSCWRFSIFMFLLFIVRKLPLYNTSFAMIIIIIFGDRCYFTLDDCSKPHEFLGENLQENWLIRINRRIDESQSFFVETSFINPPLCVNKLSSRHFTFMVSRFLAFFGHLRSIVDDTFRYYEYSIIMIYLQIVMNNELALWHLHGLED